MSKPNTTEEAVEQLKNIVKSEIVEPTDIFCNKYISLRAKIILLIVATIYVFGLLIYSLYQINSL